ncbi:RloB family protein [Collinsella aerofaciens]|uniref:RloB family protein n=1 Tax=Collinsella aerofaciens TaxID=74426 RepID=UPI00359C402A
MVAKKARDWRSGRREGRSRMVQMTRHLVVSEGKETEPRYFEGVRAALDAANGRKVSIVVKGTGKHTLDLLGFAVEHCRYAPETFDHVWLVFDKDDFPAADFDAMERKFAELSDGSRTFHALWSNPCFELWPLLHLRYTSAPMSAAECQRALSQAMSKGFGVDYRKNIDGLFDLVEENREEALARAARLDGHHDSLGNMRPSDRNPATRAGDIFEELGPYLG